MWRTSPFAVSPCASIAVQSPLVCPLRFCLADKPSKWCPFLFPFSLPPLPMPHAGARRQPLRSLLTVSAWSSEEYRSGEDQLFPQIEADTSHQPGDRAFRQMRRIVFDSQRALFLVKGNTPNTVDLHARYRSRAFGFFLVVCRSETQRPLKSSPGRPFFDR